MKFKRAHSTKRGTVGTAPLLVFCIFSLLSFLYSSANFVSAPPDSSAASIAVGASIPVVLELSAPSSVIIPSPDVGNSAVSSADMSATVSTNNPVGYNLFLNMQEELATDHDNTCLRHGTVSTPLDPAACADIDTEYKISSASGATLATNQWGVSLASPWTSWSAVPSAIDTALTVDTFNSNATNRTTTIKAGAKVDMGVVAGTYGGVVEWSAVPIPLPSIYISDVSPSSGPPGTEITVTGTNFNYLSALLIDNEPCEDVAIVSDSCLTCTIPEIESTGTFALAVTSLVGSNYVPSGDPEFTVSDPNYVGEVWGFSMDTSIATGINFQSAAPTALEVDFGGGSWITFAQGATISGTAIPTAGAGNLAKIRVRPVDTDTAGWLPSNGSILSSNITAITAMDYPITTLSMSSKSDTNLTVLSSKTSSLFYGATALTTPISFSNTPGYTVVAMEDDFLMSAHTYNTALELPVDLGALSRWNISSIGYGFLNATHYGNDSLRYSVDLSPLSGWNITATSYNFLYTTHIYNYSIEEPVDLSPLAQWPVTSIGGGFLSSTHYSNSAMKVAVDLSPLASWEISSIGGEFLSETHYSNTSLMDISAFRLPNWAIGKMASGWNNMYQTFALSSASQTTGGEPTFMNGTPISSDGTPSDNRQTYLNRSSITPANSYWK